MRSRFRILNSEFKIRTSASSLRLVNLGTLVLISAFGLLPSAFAGTHVTATYDLGANPRVMATVNGTPEYGLVFAQRNKPVTYNSVQYGTNEIKAYLDVNGQLNDGAGNLWLDLIPNLGATPADSFYVVTLNIQGSVNAEIWVVPDQATISAALCRQAQSPSATAPALFYQFLQSAGADMPQRQKLNFSGSGVACTDNAGQFSTDCTISGGGGGSVPTASATTTGTVKTDATAADPVVYLKSSADSLLAAKANAAHSHAESDVTNLVTDLTAKVPTSRTISTTAPLAGGGALSGDLSLSIPAATSTQNGYLASSDWTTFNNKESALTFNAPFSRAVNTISCSTCVTAVTGSSPISSSGGTTPAISIATASASAIGAGNVAGTTNEIAVSYAGGTGTLSIASSFDLTGKTSTAPIKATTAAGAPASCTANKDLLIETDAAPAGQQLFVCNATGNGWSKVGDGGGSGPHNLLSSTHSDTTAAAVARGDLVVGQGATPSWQRLALGTSGKFLGSDGTDAVWTSATPSGSVLGTGRTLSGGAGIAAIGDLSADRTISTASDEADFLAVSTLTCGAGTKGKASVPSTSLTLCDNSATPTLRTLVDDSRSISTSAPLGGGGDLSADRTLTCSTCEVTGNKNAASGYAGLTASTKLGVAQGQEVWALTDLSDVAITTPATAQTVRYNGTSWVNVALACADVANCPSLVTSGTAGNGPSKAGDATTAARSNHDHRSIHTLTWFFAGTPSTGVQNMTLVFPESAVNFSILDMRVTVNTTSASSSTFNIQRCTANCTGTSPTFANIYSANLTLSANTRTATKAAAPDQNVSGLAAGDQFKANLVTIGSSLADVTVTMTYKYDTTN